MSKPAPRRWSLVTALTWGSSALLATSLVLVLALSFRAGVRSAEDLLGTWAATVVTSVSERLGEHLEPVRTQSARIAAILAESEPGPDGLADLLGASLAAAPQLAGTVLVRTDATGVTVRIAPDGVPVARALRPQDPGERDLANAAEAMRRAGTRDGAWGDVVRGRGGGDAVVNFRQPVWAGERFVGMLTTGVRTSELARYLERISAPNDAVAFVLLGEDQVVAASSLDMRTIPRARGAALPRIADVDDPALRAIWNPIDEHQQDDFPVAPGFEFHVHELDDGRNVAYLYQYVHDLGSTPWIVGCYFAGSQYDDALREIRFASIVGLAVLALTAFATFLTGRGLGRPILRLADAAQAVRDAGPGAARALPRSHLTEIDTASQAFNEMVEGLRERERLRTTFGRYVPESVVDALVADGGVLRPQTRVCTMLFTDIAGFSTVSEQLSPEELIGTLNEYFSVIVGPIERHGGVIHQFQGDAILATYNLPVPQEDHAAQAVRSALEIQEATRGRTFGPGVPLPTRVGVNTGPAVCGTVGGAGRLGFTVHGDHVNLAARIEEMNKTLGTRVLVAGSTVERAGDRFAFTEVGELPVRGREQRVAVYRVAGPHSTDERAETRADTRAGTSTAPESSAL